jgi:protein TonB
MIAVSALAHALVAGLLMLRPLWPQPDSAPVEQPISIEMIEAPRPAPPQPAASPITPDRVPDPIPSPALVIPAPEVPGPPRPAPPVPRAASRPAPAPPIPASIQPPASPAIAPPAPFPPAQTGPSPGWRDAIAGWIDRNRAYPEAARRAGTEGTAVLRFTVRHDGQVEEVTLQSSSGSDRLDRASLDLLRGARVPAAGPADPPQASFSVPIRYRLTP